MRKLVVSAVVAGSMVAGGAAGVLLGVPGISHAADSTVTAGAEPAATTATTTAPGTPDPAHKGPLADVIDNALKGLVDNKTITQSQSDAVKAAIESQMANLPKRGPGGPGGAGFGFGFKADVLGVASKVLGISADDLATQLHNGTSLADIAKSKNVDVQKVIDALVADANTKIDQAVKDSKLTNDQATKIKSNLKDHITNLVNNAHPMGGHHGGPGGPGFGPPPGDDQNANTQSSTA